MRTTEITANTTLDELDGVQIDGPNFTIPGSPVEGESITVVDPVTGTEFVAVDRNMVSAAQFGVIRAEFFTLGYSRQMKLADALAALREVHKLTDRQQDSILVDKIRGAQASLRRGLETTEGQDNMAIRIIDAVVNGKSLGRGQEHLDRKIATLSAEDKSLLKSRFAKAETRGQYQKAYELFNALVGTFNRNVGVRADERRQTRVETTPVSQEVYAAWSSGASVEATEPVEVDDSNDAVKPSDEQVPVDPSGAPLVENGDEEPF